MTPSSRSTAVPIIPLALLFLLPACASAPDAPAEPATSAGLASAGYTGSGGCRECHERFYELWAPSHHGLAMQPFTGELARTALSSRGTEIRIGGTTYSVHLDGSGGRVEATNREERVSHPIAYALGGKNVFYFLTPMERGRLQVLPLAFDVRREEWFDTTASAVRHMTGGDTDALDWRAPEYTFNTSCHGCHVSQVKPNYDLETDTYWSTWTEPGINCETCHGPGEEHVRVCREAGDGKPPEDLRIVLTKAFDVEQTNSLCGSCHAKRIPLSPAFEPGGRFFDQLGLVALEHQDFWPDGRDLGENYTHTGWLLSPCVASGELDCVHCHTSSGRFRQAEDPDRACTPCHEERVADPASHTRHPVESEGSRCISCHMPETEFARMTRHDHSMRPPMPAATLEFGSPNACTLCHRDRPAEWADRLVRQWRGRDYQAATLEWAGLIAAAREGDWTRLPEMLRLIEREDTNPVVATSLVRLVHGCEDESKWPSLRAALEAPSPLVRAAAAEALGDRLTGDSLAPLVRAARDEFRLVRVRAAAALAEAPMQAAEIARARDVVDRATAELLESFRARPDDAASHHNLGNFHLARGRPAEALREFETAIRLRPDQAAPLVNAASLYAARGENDVAEARLRRAMELAPASAAPMFNLGLLLAEEGRLGEAERLLRSALEADPGLAAAAYNLGVILSERDLAGAIRWTRRASELRPRDARYAYTAAFYSRKGGRTAEAERLLRDMLERFPGYADAYGLLAAIYEETGRPEEAMEVYRRASAAEELPPGLRAGFAARLQARNPAP